MSSPAAISHFNPVGWMSSDGSSLRMQLQRNVQFVKPGRRWDLIYHDYQYENTPLGIFELVSKVEYAVVVVAYRLDLASTAFSKLLELETR